MNQLSTLALVDPDPRGLETLTYGFEREGFKVSGTSDTRFAGDLVRTSSPQLAIVSLRPGRSGPDLIRTLRSNGHALPVVSLGPPHLKPAALAAGASDFLPIPLFLRDVVSVSRLAALKQSAPDAAHAGGAVEIQGRLSEFYGLFYLLRAIAVTGRSGILLMNRGNRRAELRFSEGTVMAAHVAALQGLPAVHHLLLWEEAILSFKFRAVPKRTQIHLSSQELLDESERFLRDLAFSARDLGSPRTVYVPAADRDARTTGLQPSHVGPVLSLFDGHRALAEVIEESPFRVFDTLRVVKRLLDARAITAQPVATDDGGPRSLMEQWAFIPDARGVVGDRRKPSRPRLKAMPATGSAPIPLTVKKTAASGEIPVRKHLRTPTAAEIAREPTVQVKVDALPAPEPAPLVPARPAPITAREAPITAREAPQPHAPAPHVHPHPRPHPHPHPHPQTAPTKAPAPVAAHNAPVPASAAPSPPAAHATGDGVPSPAPRPDSKARLKKVAAQVRLTPNTAFDAVEADFFAREADLYKREAVENFDDLDGGADPAKRPGAVRAKKKK